jgi:outer membrane protein OmpA-like peptidoglycan-associated protein
LKKVLSLTLMLCFAMVAMGQEPKEENLKSRKKAKVFNTLSFGLQGHFLVDLQSDLYDTPLSSDPYSFRSANAPSQFGFGAYLEKQFTPFIAWRGSFRQGELSGSNGVEYYQNRFWQAGMGLNFYWNNINPRNQGGRINIVSPLWVGYGDFEAERFLEFDDSFNGRIVDNYFSLNAGLGLQYEISKHWRAELELHYNLVRNDGFDGFDYATAWEPYSTLAIGLAYTFGPQKRSPLYATNYWESPYFEMANYEKALQLLSQKLDTLALKDSNTTALLKQGLEDLKNSTERQEAALLKLQEQLNEAPKTERAKDTSYSLVASVYFAFDQADLSVEAKKVLLAQCRALDGQLGLIAYSDPLGNVSYNLNLEQRRAEAVKAFLTKHLGWKEEKVIIMSKPKDSTPLDDQSLMRRVDIFKVK